VIVFAGLPVGADPQEKFYTTALGAKRVLQERTRTRFTQGAGRATRNPNDRAVVVVLGKQLIAFAGDHDVQEGTHREIRAELEVGIRNGSRRTTDELAVTIDKFFSQDPSWNTHIEPAIRALRERYAAEAVDTKVLQAAAPYEIQALEAAWRGSFDKAGPAGRTCHPDSRRRRRTPPVPGALELPRRTLGKVGRDDGRVVRRTGEDPYAGLERRSGSDDMDTKQA
jgi:hypothetical protein